jgi:hypothetical protein
MVIFPITMLQAAAVGSHLGEHHHSGKQADHTHENAAAPYWGDAIEAAQPNDCPSPGHSSHGESGQTCCNLVCHSFALPVGPIVCSPVSTPIATAMTGDEQVAGIFSGRIERPPRTV